jgi:hypothetical protein
MPDLFGPLLRLAERHVSVPGRFRPLLAALIALMCVLALVIWTPFQRLFLDMPSSTPARLLTTAAGAFLIWWIFGVVEKQVRAQEVLGVDVAVSGIQSGPWDSVKTRSAEGETVIYGLRIILSTVRITNRSPSARVNLLFHLKAGMFQKENKPSVFEADGIVRGLDAAGQPEPPEFPGPLVMNPETTQNMSLVFKVLPGMVFLIGGMKLDPKGAHLLTVTDLVSGKSRELRVPNTNTGSIIKLR